MIYAYIAVALVVGLLIGFAALAVAWLARSVGKSIRSRTLELVSAYDDLLEERSRELAGLESRQPAPAPESPAAPAGRPQPAPAPAQGAASGRTALMGALEQVLAAPYRDGAAARLYGKIRAGFAFSPAEALARVNAGAPRPGPATRLLEQLSFNTVFELSTLPGERQYQLLCESLDEPGRALARQYAGRRGGFDSLGFYDFLRQTAYAEPRPPVLRVAPMTRCVDLPPQVRVVEDPAICEGFVLEADGRVFDYCIKAREIG